MEEDTDTDSDFESAEEGSEYFSVSDGGDEIQFQQLYSNDKDYFDYDEQNEDRSVGGEDIPVETFSSINPSRRSNRVLIKRRKEILLTKPSKCHTNSNHYPETSQVQQRIHPRKKANNFPTYSKPLSQDSTLNRQIRVHTGEKPYECPTCPKSFVSSYGLKVHIRFHTGEMPYQCVTCSKSFSHPSDLKVHIRVHTGEKPYQCVTCSKSFSQLSNLRKHIVRLHKINK